jgi:mannose-1-phosphate guanylyltransferase
MNDHLYAVIMAGGVGSRLWPRSRTATPKQFLDLLGPQTMMQETVGRLDPLIPLSRTLVVVGEDHAPALRSQLPGLPEENIILEPGPRGTAPCIGLAAVVLFQRDPQAIMAVFPSDHCIADPAGFRQAIGAGARLAQDGSLVTLGVLPDQPHTGYGYIQRGEPLGQVEGQAAFWVRRFAEKPDAAQPQEFVSSGEYYWNAGIFVWQVTTILAQMSSLLPQLFEGLQVVAEAWQSEERRRVLWRVWDQVPRTTIDYGVMEKADRVAVVPIDIGWNDVGNWAALAELAGENGSGNVVHGPGGHLLLDTADTYVYSTAGRLVATVGLNGWIVVDTPDALLICPRDRAQAVREVVERLKTEGLDRYL